MNGIRMGFPVVDVKATLKARSEPGRGTCTLALGLWSYLLRFGGTGLGGFGGAKDLRRVVDPNSNISI